VASGGVIVAVTLAAVVIRFEPGPNFLDRWGFSIVSSSSSRTWRILADIGTAPVVAAGGALAALVAVRRDRWLAFACLAGPALAGALTQFVLKPLSGREIGTGLCFPSGHVTGAGALVAVGLLVTPGHWRWMALVPAATVLALVACAVVALGWHYPSDTVAGGAVGVASVVFVEAGIRTLRRR